MAATAIDSGTPAATRKPDRPTDDTAVPPPGIGISEAIVDTKMLAASSVQKEMCPPKATMQASRHKPYPIEAPKLPIRSRATFDGLRRAAHNVPPACFTGGTIVRCSLGTPNTTP